MSHHTYRGVAQGRAKGRCTLPFVTSSNLVTPTKINNCYLGEYMKKVKIYTDGACSGNPGPGGYAVILKYNEHEKELVGSEEFTTNNKMELTAVIVGLKALKEPCDVELFSDSKYVVDAINEGWLKKWVANAWIKSNRKRVANIDLWEQLLDLIKIHNVKFNKVKGHSGHPENERCDRLAVQASENVTKRKI